MTIRSDIHQRVCSIAGNPDTPPRLMDQALGIWHNSLKQLRGLTRYGAGPISKALAPSLPSIDTSEQDRERVRKNKADDRALNSASSSKPKSDDDKPTIRRKAYVSKQVQGFAGITVTEYSDGTTVVKPEKTAPKEADAVLETARHELLQIALDHLQKQAGHKATKPEDTPTQKGETTMGKTKPAAPTTEQIEKAMRKLDVIAKSDTRLSGVARTGLLLKKSPLKGPRTPVYRPEKAIKKALAPEPERFDKSSFAVAAMPGLERAGYLSRKFDHDQEQAQQLKKSQAETTPPSHASQLQDFYESLKTPAERMTTDRYNKLSPWERLAVQAGLDIDNLPEGIDLTTMVPETMKALAAKLKRQQYGIADPPKDNSNVRFASQL
ncbi:MAG: hypothetical protein WCK54_18350 [Desulfuromonadales bacterium]